MLSQMHYEQYANTTCLIPFHISLAEFKTPLIYRTVELIFTQ